MSHDFLLQRTRDFFPSSCADAIQLEPLEKGGSDRKFYRVRGGVDVAPLILVHYGTQRAENRHYVGIAQFLAGMGIRVPRILRHDEAEGLIWMQDLGERDLWASREEPWTARRPLYESALTQARDLHTAALPKPGLTLQPVFDAPLYQWEQEYFFEHCAGRHFGLDAASFDRGPLTEIAARLAALPRVLVHRDFQSQNIMIVGGEAWLIDFQGLRPGLPHYDLASLLYDPYVTFKVGQREELMDFYLAGNNTPRAEFFEIYQLCAMQRLMQALGAYGYLGHVKGRDDFIRHIPAALASLRSVLARMPALAKLHARLSTL